MKKKHLLNESEVRKMMKFANLKGLSDGFVDKLQEGHYGVDEELYEAEEDDMEDPGAMGDLGAADDEMPAEPGMDAGMDAEMGAVDAGPEEIASAIIQGAIDAAKDYGVDAAIEREGEEGMEAPPEEDDMGPMGDMPEDPEAEELEEMLDDAGFNLQEDEDVVNEVARRVAKRLMEMKRRA